MLYGVGGCELGVWNEGSGELVETLAELYNHIELAIIIDSVVAQTLMYRGCE